MYEIIRRLWRGLFLATGAIVGSHTSESNWAILLEQKRCFQVFVAARGDRANTAGREAAPGAHASYFSPGLRIDLGALPHFVAAADSHC